MNKTKKVLEIEKRHSKDIKDLLIELYESHQMTLTQTAQALGISTTFIRQQLIAHSIALRSSREVNQKRAKEHNLQYSILREEIERLYIAEGKTKSEICTLLSIDSSVLEKLLKEFGICRESWRNNKIVEIERKFEMPIEQLVRYFYYEKDFSMARIQEICGMTDHSLKKVMELYSIALKESISSRVEKILSKEQLFGLYSIKELSIREIAKTLQVNEITIRKYLQKYSIEIRDLTARGRKAGQKNREKTAIKKALAIEKKAKLVKEEFNNKSKRCIVYELYCIKRFSTYKISSELDLSKQQIKEMIERYNFREKRKKIKLILKCRDFCIKNGITIGARIKELLAEGKAIKEIKEILSLNSEEFCIYCRKNGIGYTETHQKTKIFDNKNLGALIRKLYWDEQKSVKEISILFSVPIMTLKRTMDNLGIKRRESSEGQKIYKRSKRYEEVMQKVKVKCQSAEYREAMRKRVRNLWAEGKLRISKKINSMETMLLQMMPSNVCYVGDGRFWRRLRNGKNTNPDFIVEPIKKTRKVIYFHGIYWHSSELHNRGLDLVKQWKNIGYDCLVIWEDELKNKECLKRISNFLGKESWQLRLF